MTGYRKLTGLLASYAVLLLLAWLQPGQLGLLVDGLCWLAGVFVVGNFGEHGAQAWRTRRDKLEG